MSLEQFYSEHATFLAVASRLIGQPARAFQLESDSLALVGRKLRVEARCGLDERRADSPAMVRFETGNPGHQMAVGATRYRLETHTGPLRLVRVVAPQRCCDPDDLYDFWAVAQREYRRLYAHLRRLSRQVQHQAPPLMPAGDQQRLWNNTIGFLRHGGTRLQSFGLPFKRGVLLLGEPGNGKTMACRWLRGQCNRNRLTWRNVSAEQFDCARREGEAHELFELSRPGIVFFDDVDMAIRDREQNNGGTQDHSTFLGGLDGIDSHHGVVYVFTTNAKLNDLDPAFRRPGRIDLVLEFAPPSPELRQRLMQNHWPAEVLANIDAIAAVRDTDGLSFAELDEVKRILVLHFLEHNRWDWPRAWSEFQTSRGEMKQAASIGFHAAKQTAADSQPSIVARG